MLEPVGRRDERREVAVGRRIHRDGIAEVRVGVEERGADPARGRMRPLLDRDDPAALDHDVGRPALELGSREGEARVESAASSPDYLNDQAQI